MDFLRDLPETRSIFAQAFSEPGTRALISSLHVGAELAGTARETVMAERFANMARLCEQIVGEADGQTSGSSEQPEDNPAPALGSLSPAQHQQFAAAHLTDAARQALRETYALMLPADADPALQAGRFDPRATQAMARILESPASAAGGNLITVGQYPMSQQFLEDASNGFSFYIDDASQKQATADLAASPMRPPSREATADASPPGHPLIDWSGAETTEPPQLGQETLARIAQGYERLIELCGSEQQARTLTCYANQTVMSGYAAACAQSAVLSLPDGARGHISGPNPGSDPDGQTVFKQETRITFSIGESGRPRIDVDDRIAGRAPFVHPDGKTTILSPDSYVQAHFRAELGEDGRLALLEAPSYRFDIRPDDTFPVFAL